MRILLCLVAVLATAPALANPQSCAQIRGGFVVNMIVAEPGFAPGDGSQIVCGLAAKTGDAYANGVLTPVAPPPPAPQTVGLNFLQFVALFTPAEQAAIFGSADTQVKAFNLMAAGAPQIDLADPRVVAGIGYLASISIVSPARVAAILAGQAPG
jgi:hypothetical protein